MRSALICLLAASSLSMPVATAQAGAGVSPFISMIEPDALDASYHRLYDFSSVDAVYVMSVADARSVRWTSLVSTRRGAPLIGSVKSNIAADEVLAIADSGVVSTRMIAIADDALVQDLIDASLSGPCGAEPAIEGTVEADLLSTSVARSLRGLSSAEPAVAVGHKSLSTSGITSLSASVTGSVAVTIINPDSMLPNGWCSANPTPHP
ncbi:MAG: hypothetical protein AB8H79_04870 [Myxococcota bacterium]